jgi:hypothetical protein
MRAKLLRRQSALGASITNREMIMNWQRPARSCVAILASLACLGAIKPLPSPEPWPTLPADNCQASRNFLSVWKCPRARYEVLGLMLQGPGFRVVMFRNHLPVEVVEPLKHLRGLVQYADAKIIEPHDRNQGHVGVPIESDGRRYILVWRFIGEFTSYVGPRTP